MNATLRMPLKSVRVTNYVVLASTLNEPNVAAPMVEVGVEAGASVTIGVLSVARGDTLQETVRKEEEEVEEVEGVVEEVVRGGVQVGPLHHQEGEEVEVRVEAEAPQRRGSIEVKVEVRVQAHTESRLLLEEVKVQVEVEVEVRIGQEQQVHHPKELPLLHPPEGVTEAVTIEDPALDHLPESTRHNPPEREKDPSVR